MSIRLLVADDHEVVRTGLKSLVSGTEIQIVAEAATGDEAVRMVEQHKPEVVLLDIRMADADGLNALGRIKLSRPKLPVLMLSGYDNPTYVARALALGASGYLLKDAGRDDLLAAIRRVAQGGDAWKREELRRVTGALATPRVAGDIEVPLTQRETEVLAQLAFGLTNKEIAQVLHISYETVKEHVQHVLRKLGVVDRTQAALWAVRRN
ncbi:MAG: response regulator, partial [Candidatus Saccharimonadales bacterium]